jgi:phosphatidate cytidylyltransferase
VRVLAEPGTTRRGAAGGRRWADLRVRVASAVVLVPGVLLCLWLGGWAWELLVAAAAAALGVEWLQLWAHGQGGARLRLGVALGFLYIGPAAAALVWLRGGAEGFANVLFVLLVVWGSDIGAYAVGRLVGGVKLAPRISPGKTVSGAVGGLVAAVAIGVLAAASFIPGGALRAGVVGALLGIAAQVGDLLESALKRHFGVKDSGRLIPGHGGALDRLDALLLAAPAAALIAALRGGGVVWR